jgi:hypothetical protein
VSTADSVNAGWDTFLKKAEEHADTHEKRYPSARKDKEQTYVKEEF